MAGTDRLVVSPEERQKTDAALNTARQAAYHAVGLTGREAASDRYDRALAAALQSLADQGYRLVPQADPSTCHCVGLSHKPECPEWVLPI